MTLPIILVDYNILSVRDVTVSYWVIPSHGNPQITRALFDGYLFKYFSIKYQTFHKVKPPENLFRYLQDP